MAPSGTTVSLFSSSRFAPRLARMPTLLARANPRFEPISIRRTSGRRRARPTVLRELVRRGRENPRSHRLVEQHRLERPRRGRHIAHWYVDRGVAAALAGRRRVEQYRRHTRVQRLERRESQPLVLRQKREGPRVGIQLLQLLVGDVVVPAHLRLERLRGNRLLQILA